MSDDLEHYYYNESTGMEYWHDGEFTRSQCHDGVGLVTEHRQSLADYEAMVDVMDQESPETP